MQDFSGFCNFVTECARTERGMPPREEAMLANNKKNSVGVVLQKNEILNDRPLFVTSLCFQS